MVSVMDYLQMDLVIHVIPKLLVLNVLYVILLVPMVFVKIQLMVMDIVYHVIPAFLVLLAHLVM